MKSFLKYSIRMGIFLLACIALLLMMLPTIISIPAINASALAILNERVQGNVRIKDLEAGWFSGIWMRNIEITDSLRRRVVVIDSIHWDSPLIKLLLPVSKLGKIHIDNPHVTFYRAENGEFSLQNVFLKPAVKSSKRSKPTKKVQIAAEPSKQELFPFFKNKDVDIEVNNGKLAFVDKSTTTVSDIHIDTSLQKEDMINALLTCNVEKNGSKGYLKASGSLKSNKPKSREGDFTFEANRFPVDIIDHLITLNRFKKHGLLVDLIGPELNINITQKIQNEKISVDIKGASAKLTLDVALVHDNDVLSIPKVGMIDIAFDAASLNKILKHLNVPYTLKNKITLMARLNPKEQDKPIECLLTTAEPIILVNRDAKELVTRIETKVDMLPASREMSMRAAAQLVLNNSIAVVTNEMQVSKEKSIHGVYSIQGAIGKIGTFFSKDLEIASKIFGDSATLSGDLQLVADTISGTFTGINMNPAHPYTYIGNSCHAAWKIDRNPKDQRKIVDGSLQTNTFALTVHGTEDPAKEVRFALQLQPLDKKAYAKTPRCVINGTIQNHRTDTNVDLSQARINIEANGSDLPVGLIARAVFNPEKAKTVEELLGDQANFTFNCSLEQFKTGSVNLDLSSVNFRTGVVGSIKDGIFTCPNPIRATLQISPKTGKIKTPFGTIISAEKPIEFVIGNEGLRIPIKNFSWHKLQIKEGKLDIGKLRVKGKKTFGTIMAILRSDQTNREKIQDLWLTPVYFSMQHGVLDIKRADALLADKIPLATWGLINFIDDRVQMIVAVQGSFLRDSLGIKNIDPKYMLQLPITGTTSEVKLDSQIAGAKVASLKLRESKSDKLSILGEVFGAAASFASKEAAVPPPTTNPLPWEKR